MLNEERVRLMTRLAAYESKEGKEDIEISGYYRKDYTSRNTLAALIWVTVGYVIALAIGGIAFMDVLIGNVNMTFFIILAGGVVIGYIVVLFVYGIIAHETAARKHNEARQRMKKYNRDLLRLNKMYEKEKL